MKKSKVIPAFVGANSDHPHAADIVKALLDNSEIKPEWITKPELKRAYRVFYTNTGQTCTADNEQQAKHFESDEMFVKWISDWIEYDPAPKKWETYDHIADTKTWPSDLVARIAKIDIKAAEWLRDNVKREAVTLRGLMRWRDTPQGFNYWKNISNQLGE